MALNSQTSPTQTIAFFDLDRTLIRPNSALLYSQYERRHGRISRGQFIRAAFWMGCYHLNLLDIDKAYAKALAIYRHLPSELIKKRGQEFFHTEIAHLLLPGAEQALVSHRSQDHMLVLITNGSPYQAHEAAAQWGFDHWIANNFLEDDQGLLTGGFEKPLCYGYGKFVRAEKFCKARDLSLQNSYFYTDSYSDLSLLKAVAHPRVVHPDPKLKGFAKQNQWPILNWAST